jgi:hypothetical protein
MIERLMGGGGIRGRDKERRDTQEGWGSFHEEVWREREAR